MAEIDNESEYNKNYSSDDRTNELEQTLVQVAARVDPDARNSEDDECNSINPKLYDHESSSSVHNTYNEHLNIKRKRDVDEEAFENKREKKYCENNTFKNKSAKEINVIQDKSLNLKQKQFGEEDTLRKGFTYWEGNTSFKEKNIESQVDTGKVNCEDKHEKSYSVNKRKSIQQDEGPSKLKKAHEHDTIDNARVVATHYNALEEKGLEERSKSRIIYLRNFHNWIKSMLINEYLTKVKDKKKYNEPVRVHDMCCGKGGDLLKWRKGNITHLICSDIASVALEHCKTRYHDMANRSYRERNSGSIFTIECIAADCSKVRLREKYKDASMKLDIVSCQFGFHYSFESLPQAECMMKNAAECLLPGGYFIGTVPDSNELVARVRKSDANCFGNDVYNIIFDCDTTTPPLFGAKYNFYLDGSVDCPEFLIYFPFLVKLAKRYGLKLVKKEKFYDFYERMKLEGRNLLTNVKSLETYPAPQGVELVGNAKDDYEHARLFLESQVSNTRIGTLSKSEWEATSLYLTFAFEKVKGTWNADGVEVYDL